MAAGDIYRLRLHMRQDGVPTYVYFHFKCIGSTAKATNLVDLWIGAGSVYWSHMAFMIGQGVKLIDVYAQKINSGTPDEAQKPAAPTLTGNAQGVLLPRDHVFQIQWKTANPSPRRRGWNYFSGITSQRHVGGYMTRPQIENCESWVNQFLGVFGASGSGVNWRFGVYSRACGGYHPNANPACWTQVVSGFVNPVLTRNEKRLEDKAHLFPHPYL